MNKNIAIKSETRLKTKRKAHLSLGLSHKPRQKKISTNAFGIWKKDFTKKSSSQYVSSLRKKWR